MQGLTDTDTSTCVIRSRSAAQYRQLNLAITFEQCLQLQSITILGKNVTASMSSPSDQTGWNATARTVCSSQTGKTRKKCVPSGQKSGAFYYNCSTVSARQVTVEVSAGFSICQLNIYAFPGKTNNNLDCFLLDENLVRGMLIVQVLILLYKVTICACHFYVDNTVIYLDSSHNTILQALYVATTHLKSKINEMCLKMRLVTVVVITAA